MTLQVLLAFAAGAVLASLLLWVISRGHSQHLQTLLAENREHLNQREEQLGALSARLQEALEAKGRAEQEALRVAQIEQELTALRQVHTRLTVQLAELNKASESDQEKYKWVERAEQAMREAFRALATEALQSNADLVLKRVNDQMQTVLSETRGDWRAYKEELTRLVEPLDKTLGELESDIRHLEQKREGAYQGLQEQLRQLASGQSDLQTATISLAQALKSTAVRAKWGEVQLRRIVEMAGMVEHVDFSEQPVADSGRPDLLVHLPNGGVLAIDAKTPMQAYLEALEAPDHLRSVKMDAHVRALKQHIQQLAGRRYWQQFGQSPELVVMFIPNEASLGVAFEREPNLLESAIQQRVLPTTPITLLALLKAVAFGWQQYQVAENARAIALQGKQLHERLRGFLQHFSELGKRLDSAAKYYNEAAGSLEQRVLPTARRLADLEAASEDLPPTRPIERQLQTLEPVPIEVPETSTEATPPTAELSPDSG